MSKQIERRDFLKGALLGSAGLASAAFVGCSTEGSSGSNAQAMKYPGITDEVDFKNSKAIIDPITNFIEEKTYDIVVVGAGTAGIPAVLTALEEGASVCCLQKEPTAISQGNVSSGIIQEESDDFGKLSWMQEVRKTCSYRVNMDLFDFFVNYSGETLCWLDKVAEEVGFPAVTYATTGTKDYGNGSRCKVAMHWFGTKPKTMQDLIIALANLAEKNGADIFYETAGVQLVKEQDGAVSGVIGETRDGYVKYKANKAVIVATGDYQNNESMVEKYIPDIARFNRKQVNKTGDGHLMCLLAGATMSNAGHAKQCHDYDAAGVPIVNLPFVALDANGQRFMNENIQMISWNQRTKDLSQADPGVVYKIFDNAYQEKAALWGLEAPAPKSLENYIPELTNGVGVMEDLIDTHRCDTLEELADALRLDAGALKSSIEKYNSLCDTGLDTDFGRPLEQMTKIDTPPYWGIRHWVRITTINAGVNVDGNYRVVNEKGEPIPGLFAVGTTGGNLCGDVDWDMSTGVSLGHCLTSGRYSAIYAITGNHTPSNPVAWEEVASLYAPKQ